MSQHLASREAVNPWFEDPAPQWEEVLQPLDAALLALFEEFAKKEEELAAATALAPVWASDKPRR